MTDISLIPTLKSEGWKVMTRAKLKSMKKEELIETIETLENNYGATIERANNSYNYGKSEIERLEKENTELKELIKKYNKSNMICFAADMVYKALNPKSSMDTPNCVYIKIESELENWENSK